MISSTTNVDKGTAELIVDARQTNTTDWWVFNVADPVAKPFIVQENDPLKPLILGAGSDHYFKTGYMMYSVEWMGRAGYYWWQTAVKIT